MEVSQQFAIIGLAVMGSNLARNMAGKGFRVVVYDHWPELRSSFAESAAKEGIVLADSLKALVGQLESPRKIMLMIRAGKPVDEMIEQLIPLLDPGDVIIDGGNSHFPDTTRRTNYLESKGLLYIGTGVSGGEEGALLGPSIMPGGSKEAWPLVKPIFQAIAAKVDDGTPCCDWVGEEGAGHFVKMVHNGIEYGDMQLICEAYQIMKDLYGLSYEEMHQAFKEWNEGELNSYLIEITRDILAFNDNDGQPLVEKILDTAGQKGTGKWTGIAALDLGVPLTLIGESVFARCLSALKDERTRAAEVYPPKEASSPALSKLEDLRQALYASKIVSYAQGYMLMRAAAEEHHWDLNYGGIALMWRGGCIIRSAFLGKIKEAFDRDPRRGHGHHPPWAGPGAAGAYRRASARSCPVLQPPAPRPHPGIPILRTRLSAQHAPAHLWPGRHARNAGTRAGVEPVADDLPRQPEGHGGLDGDPLGAGDGGHRLGCGWSPFGGVRPWRQR